MCERPVFNSIDFRLTIVSVKTKVQQRALAGEKYRTTWETCQRLIRGDLSEPKSPVGIHNLMMLF